GWRAPRAGAGAEGCGRAQRVLIRPPAGGAARARPPLLALRQRDRERADDLLHHLVLGCEDVGEIAIEPLGPQMPAAAGIDELRRDAHAIAGLADAALEHEAHAESPPDLLHFDLLALVHEGGGARDDNQA